MRISCLMILVACSGDDGQALDCRRIATKLSDPPTCRIDIDGLYVDPAAACVEVWGEGHPRTDLCQSLGTETATIRASYLVDGAIGLIVTRAADPEAPVCEFRPCL